jgi:hypothetical protein
MSVEGSSSRINRGTNPEFCLVRQENYEKSQDIMSTCRESKLVPLEYKIKASLLDKLAE